MLLQFLAGLGKKVVYRESDVLTNIDGFLVTDGAKARVTIRKRLPANDKARGKRALMKRFTSNRRPGIYFWNSWEEQAHYGGADTSGW
jgi:hypothetical protein